MEFIGYTAFIDAVIAIVAWGVLYMRKSSTGMSAKVQALSSYLLATFVFLILISATLLKTTGDMQQIMFIISDLVLWVSLILFISLMYSEMADKGSKKTMIWIFCVLAAMRTLWQIAGLKLGGSEVALIDLSGLGSSVNYALSQFDAWLMYVVWVPSAIVLIGVALKSDNAVVRSRSLMFAIGLLLITFTWAFRFLGQASVTQDMAYLLVSGASLVGFVLLLGGVLYRGSGQTQMAGQTS